MRLSDIKATIAGGLACLMLFGIFPADILADSQANDAEKARSLKQVDNRIRIKALMIQAKSADEAERDKLLATAGELLALEINRLGEIIKSSKVQEGDKFENAVIDFYKARLIEINLLVPDRSRPYVERLTYLIGCDEDRRMLAELAAAAKLKADAMQADLEKILADANDPKRLMWQIYLVPELEDILKRLEYWQAFIYYYNAVAQPRYISTTGQAELKVNLKRQELLEQAVALIAVFATDPNMTGVHSSARLLAGKCERERRRYHQAEQLFNWVGKAKGNEAFFVEASFSAVQNLIEWGAFLVREGKFSEGREKISQAQARLDFFINQSLARQLQTQLGADVKRLMLECYMHQELADALRTVKQDEQADIQQRKVQAVLKDFIHKHKNPEVRAAVGELFRKKFRGMTDYNNLDPSIALLLADIELAEAKKINARYGTEANSTDAQKKMFEHCRKASEMYERILAGKEKSPDVATILPDALWGLGELSVLQRDNFRAAEMFRELVRQYPETPRAYLAAINAVKINNVLINLLEQQNQPVSRKRRLEYVESLRLMLENWGDRPEAAQYYFDLAYTCGKLADGAKTDAEFREFQNEAISNYEKVPSDSALALWAKAEAFDLKYKLLAAGAQPDKNQAARLMNDLNRFGALIHDLLQGDLPAEERVDLGTWGSQCEFNAQLIAGEILGNSTAALSAIEKLPERWPGTAVLEDAREYAIRQRVQRGDVSTAIQQLDAFETDYGDVKAEELMELVISKIRQAIITRQLSGDMKNELSRYRAAYLKFAETIYNNQIKNATPGKRYQIIYMLADALVQSETLENAARALQLFKNLQKVDEKRQQRQLQEAMSLIARQMETLRDASRNVATARTLNTQLMETVNKLKMGSWRSSTFSAVKYAMRRLDREHGTSASDTSAKVQAVFDAITRAYEALQAAVKMQVNIDANVVLGMARCYRNMGEYAKAIEEYRKLSAGLTPQVDHAMYWQAQLELCETILTAFQDNPNEMRRLGVYIRQLRRIEENLGGREYLARFDRIEAAADKIAHRLK